jgi:hypothetical protein
MIELLFYNNVHIANSMETTLSYMPCFDDRFAYVTKSAWSSCRAPHPRIATHEKSACVPSHVGRTRGIDLQTMPKHSEVATGGLAWLLTKLMPNN